jgi:hypothetical protein
LPIQRTPPFHQSNLFWGSVGAVIAILITVVATMIKDIRWLLAFAWPFATLAIWEFSRSYGSVKHVKWLTGNGSLVAALALVALDLLLAPATSSCQLSHRNRRNTQTNEHYRVRLMTYWAMPRFMQK